MGIIHPTLQNSGLKLIGQLLIAGSLAELVIDFVSHHQFIYLKNREGQSNEVLE